MKIQEATIVTFYSYKGGVGRSMALANVAWVLAERFHKRVLVIDWDLEAPGLHHFFNIDDEDVAIGLIELLNDYKDLLRKELQTLPTQLIDICKYIRTVNQFNGGGSISLMSAGRQNAKYSGLVNQFNWDEFYAKWHGFGFIEYLKQELKQSAEIDFVLVDSRTGVTDIGGICTLQLPDIVVLLFALNDQNIIGAESVAKKIARSAAEIEGRENPPAVIVRPSRVERTGNQDEKVKWLNIAALRLGEYVNGDDPNRLMAKQNIPYVGDYSYGETPIAVKKDPLGDMAESFEDLTSAIVEASQTAKIPRQTKPHRYVWRKTRIFFMKRSNRYIFGFAVILAIVSLGAMRLYQVNRAYARTVNKNSSLTEQDPERFLADAENQLLDLNIKAGRADWLKSTFITDDSEQFSAIANSELIAATTKLAEQSRRFDGLQLSPEVKRKLKLLKLSLTLPAPNDPVERRELTKLQAEMEGDYGRARFCPQGDNGGCLSLPDLEQIIGNSRDPEELKKAWLGWHNSFRTFPIRYQRFVELSNKGAREMGYKDTGAMWRSRYDMEPDAFAAEMERLWQQVKPLYDSLYTYTRRKLSEKYGRSVVPLDKPIPAHLLGNMWAQDWSNIYPLLAPADADRGYDLTQALRDRNTDPKQMVRYGEAFFTSVGFDPLPQSFWERSMFVKPADRDVVCHASAWDIDYEKDVRLKMCIVISAEDFSIIHHELGHNYYQMAYSGQPFLFRDSANEAFHEALGDTITLSVTPPYLKQLGLIDKVPGERAGIGFLLNRALDKVAFFPFAYMVDQWRWKVFSGEITTKDYNNAWWDLRLRYQGVAPPESRSMYEFDPGAKYHVPANTPYARYFLASILQFQFHRALCREAGFNGPLYQCSIYGNKKAGDKLQQMMALGQSTPWPEALKILTGEDRMDATAILDYFAPLKTWLDEQNKRQRGN